MDKTRREYLLLAIIAAGGIFLGWDRFKKNPPVENKSVEQWQNWDTTPKPKEPEKKKEEVKPEYKVYSYAEALLLSKKTHRKMFVYFYADWCGYCTKMKNETFSNEQVRKVLVDNDYIITHIDLDQDKSLGRKYFVTGLPSYLVANEDEKVEKRAQGFKSANEFVKWAVNGR